MTDVDINSLVVIMIRQTDILMKVIIFLSPQEEQWEDLLGNQNVNRKCHS